MAGRPPERGKTSRFHSEADEGVQGGMLSIRPSSAAQQRAPFRRMFCQRYRCRRCARSGQTLESVERRSVSEVAKRAEEHYHPAHFACSPPSSRVLRSRFCSVEMRATLFRNNAPARSVFFSRTMYRIFSPAQRPHFLCICVFVLWTIFVHESS